MEIQLLLTGNELMAGDTVDSNSAMIAAALGQHGWSVYRKVTVGDDLEQLCAEIKAACQTADVLIMNGGLGPTIDDMTAEALAKVAGLNRREHPDALAHLESFCGARGLALNAANLKQAMLPEGCEIIANASGTAPGIYMTIGNCEVFATPGVPGELRQMINEQVLPVLLQRYPSDEVEIRRLASFGAGESSLQNLISQRLPDWPEQLELGFRASMPVLEVKITARGAEARKLLDTWEDKLIALLDDAYLGEAPITLAEATLEALQANDLSLCTAESCTGGLIAAQITEIPGASAHFAGGIVSYSNGMKSRVLNVAEQTLAECGAVSEETAAAMLEGALQACDADLGVAVTGIAGPTGGTEEKPVGTVCIAWGSLEQWQVATFLIPFARKHFQTLVSACALDLIRRQLRGIHSEPHFFRRYRR